MRVWILSSRRIVMYVYVYIMMFYYPFTWTCAHNKLLPFICMSLNSFREDLEDLEEEERRLDPSRTKASRSLTMRTRSRKDRTMRDC